MHKDTGAPLEVNLTIGFQEERVLVRQDLYENDSVINERLSGYYTPETPKSKEGKEGGSD